MDVGKALRDIRRSRELTQIKAASKAKITQTYLSQIESNQKNPSNDVLEKLSKVYKVPVAIFYFKAMDESDVLKSKLKMYRTLKPTTDTLINELLSL